MRGQCSIVKDLVRIETRSFYTANDFLALDFTRRNCWCGVVCLILETSEPNIQTSNLSVISKGYYVKNTKRACHVMLHNNKCRTITHHMPVFCVLMCILTCCIKAHLKCQESSNCTNIAALGERRGTLGESNLMRRTRRLIKRRLRQTRGVIFSITLSFR